MIVETTLDPLGNPIYHWVCHGHGTFPAALSSSALAVNRGPQKPQRPSRLVWAHLGGTPCDVMHVLAQDKGIKSFKWFIALWLYVVFTICLYCHLWLTPKSLAFSISVMHVAAWYSLHIWLNTYRSNTIYNMIQPMTQHLSLKSWPKGLPLLGQLDLARHYSENISHGSTDWRQPCAKRKHLNGMRMGHTPLVDIWGKH